jgi:hypothetical protein
MPEVKAKKVLMYITRKGLMRRVEENTMVELHESEGDIYLAFWGYIVDASDILNETARAQRGHLHFPVDVPYISGGVPKDAWLVVVLQGELAATEADAAGRLASAMAEASSMASRLPPFRLFSYLQRPDGLIEAEHIRVVEEGQMFDLQLGGDGCVVM